MKKFATVVVLSLMAVALMSGIAMASEGAVAAAGGTDWFRPFVALAAALAIAVGAAAGASSQSKALIAALKGIARNPGAAGKITTPMIIGLAMIESLVIYALVVALLLVFKL
jgi:F-type H+-transporting ATPase subunit c